MSIQAGESVIIKDIDNIVINYLQQQIGKLFRIPVVFATPELWKKYQLQNVPNKQIPVMMIRRGRVDRQYFHSKTEAYFKRNQYSKDRPYGAIVDLSNNQSSGQSEDNTCIVTDRPLYININYLITILCKRLNDINSIIQFFANKDQVYWNETFISIDKTQEFIPIAQQFEKHYRLDIPFLTRKYIVNPVRQYPPILKVDFPIKQVPSSNIAGYIKTSQDDSE